MIERLRNVTLSETALPSSFIPRGGESHSRKNNANTFRFLLILRPSATQVYGIHEGQGFEIFTPLQDFTCNTALHIIEYQAREGTIHHEKFESFIGRIFDMKNMSQVSHCGVIL